MEQRRDGTGQRRNPSPGTSGGGDSEFAGPVTVSEHLIAERAHAIWRHEGCPEGRDRHNWIRAWWELVGEEAKRRHCS